MNTLSEYLRTRGLNLDPTQIDIDPIFEDEALIKEASDLWEAKKPLIKLVLQARINALGKKILESCPPEEVLVLRQAMVEIGALVDDFEGYKGESARRSQKNEDNTVEGTEEQGPIVSWKRSKAHYN